MTEDDPQLDIYAECVANPSQYTDGSSKIQDRTRTTASAAWNAIGIGTGAYKQTPSLIAPIQELVNGYAVDVISLLWIGNISSSFKKLKFYSYDGLTGAYPPKLHIEWSAAGPTPGWNQIQYTSEPPIPNAWNQLKQEAGTGWKKLLYEGE